MLHPRTLLLAVAAGLVALVVACGGNSGPVATPTPTPTPTPPPLTAEQAAAIADGGLLAVEDLPDADWMIEDIDHLEGDSGDSVTDDMLGSTPECQEIAAALDELGAGPGAGRENQLANRERTFDTEDESLTMRSVMSNVVIPGPDMDLQATFASIREVFHVDSVGPCFEAGMVEALESEDGIRVTRVETYTPDIVLPNGVAVGIDLEASILIFPLEMKMQLHMWPEGPAVGSLILIEMNSDLLANNMASILENAQQRLAEAVSDAQ